MALRLLVDAYSPHAHGGTGQLADWALAQSLAGRVPGFVLAGGLTPENVAAAIQAVRPWAVDTSSGVEYCAGSQRPRCRSSLRCCRQIGQIATAQWSFRLGGRQPLISRSRLVPYILLFAGCAPDERTPQDGDSVRAPGGMHSVLGSVTGFDDRARIMEILGGPLFAVAGAGESHGPAVTSIVYGCPPGVALSRSYIQSYLDRRRPGSNRHGTPRRESDKAIILSGLYSDDLDGLLGPSAISSVADGVESSALGYETGFTTGEPIAVAVLSTSQRSGDYTQFAGPTGEVRPGHTDLVKYYKSRGFVDIRGGGRSSYRSTISDVVGGSVARAFLASQFGMAILSSIVQVGPLCSNETLSGRVTEWTLENEGQPMPQSVLDALSDRLDAAEIRSYDTALRGGSRRSHQEDAHRR